MPRFSFFPFCHACLGCEKTQPGRGAGLKAQACIQKGLCSLPSPGGEWDINLGCQRWRSQAGRTRRQTELPQRRWRTDGPALGPFLSLLAKRGGIFTSCHVYLGSVFLLPRCVGPVTLEKSRKQSNELPPPHSSSPS